MAGNIHRQKKNRDFVTIDTHCLRNKGLRWDAKGLHSYLMQLPDDWKINIADLEKRSLDRHDGTMSPMRALIAAGYVYRERISGERGRFIGYDYHLFERPEQTIEWLTVNGKSIDGKTVNGKPTTNKVLTPKKVNKNEEGEESEKKQTTPTPETYDQFMERVNAETRDVEEKEKNKSPFIPGVSPNYEPGDFDAYSKVPLTDMLEDDPGLLVNGFDASTLPGAMIRTAEIMPPTSEQLSKYAAAQTDYVNGIRRGYGEPANPNATATILHATGRVPLATNGDEADAILTAWAEKNIETVKFKYGRAKRRFTPEDLEKLIIKFCGQYASHEKTATRERFLYDPARFFNDKLSGWLIDQPGFEKLMEPKNGFTQPETKYTPPPASEKIPAYTP